MDLIERATKLFPCTEVNDWRMIGGAAVHESVIPDRACRFLGPAIVRNGEFYGGTFHGGVFRGGTFRGGVFHDGTFLGGTFLGGTFHDGTFLGGTFHDGTFLGGTFHDGWFLGGTFHAGMFLGGTFHGGVFRGGVFRGGVFRGGVFRGGEFRGGMFHGGEFRGGTFHGGVFRGGEFKTTPLQLFEVLPWPVVRQANGCLAIGCECHLLEEWRDSLDRIADKHDVDCRTRDKISRVLREFEPGGLYA